MSDNEKKVIVNISADEKYPFYDVTLAESLIGGKANPYGNDKSSWELKTIDDVLKMHWLNFASIPIEKYNWIKRVYEELEQVNDYIEGLE